MLQRDILGNNRCDDAAYTHYTFSSPEGRWKVPDEEIDGFWKNYCEASCDEDGPHLYIAERPQSHMPVVNRLQLSFDSLEDDHGAPYGKEFLLDLVYAHQKVLKNMLVLDEDKSQLICCILESEMYSNGKQLRCYDIALHFPYCKTTAECQPRLRAEIIKELRRNNSFRRLDCQPTADWEGIFDKRLPLCPLPLLHSRLSKERPPTSLTSTVFEVTEEMWATNELPEVELGTVFNPNNHKDVGSGLLRIEQDDDLDFWLPLLFSVHYWQEVTTEKQVKTKKSPSVQSNNNLDPFQDKQEMMEYFIELCSPERLEKEIYWKDIGAVLYNETQGDDEGLELWCQITEKNPPTLESGEHADRDDCDFEWNKFAAATTPLTIKTLAWYAQKDSPEDYKTWHDNWVMKALEEAINTRTHADVANAIYRRYWLEFVYSSDKHRTWYKFNKHRWVPMSNAMELHQDIDDDFVPMLNRLQSKIASEKNEVDGDEADNKQRKLEKVGKLIRSIKTSTFNNCVVREASKKFFDSNFESFKDENYLLTGMENCVIEATDTDAHVRDGKPEDYITKTTRNRLRNFTWKSRSVRECMDWFHKVFPDQELLEYFLKFCSSLFIGRNSEKSIQVWTGSGDNSKSMIKKLFERALGDYCATAPTSLITAKSRTASSNATPDLARAEGKRAFFVLEPGRREVINEGIFKELTGGDTIYTRNLHQDGKEMEASFKFIMACNDIPAVYREPATMKRMYIVPFLAKFVNAADAPASKEEQYEKKLFPSDKHFENKIPALAPPFLWIMVQYFARYRQEGLQVPKIVKEHTNQYWLDMDIYHKFTDENIEKSDNTEEMLSTAQIYQEFRRWYSTNYPDQRTPNKDTVVKELSTRWGKPSKDGRWRGIRIKQEGIAEINGTIEGMM
jgi:P4 family phage/plasmid primase-like protien